MTRERRLHLPLALPYVAGLALLVGLPLVGTLLLAFTDYAGIASPRFTGFENGRRLAGDESFRRALLASASIVAIAVPLRLLAVTCLALLLHRPSAGAGVARALAYLPTVVPEPALALFLLWVLNPLYGPVAALGGPSLLTDPWGARLAVALLAALPLGEGFVVALAWRHTIPSAVHEAAALDGATPWTVLRRITLPLMAPVLLLLALRDVVVTVQASFAPTLLLTDGGPREATAGLPLFIYRAAFGYLRLGYAAAASVVVLLLTAAIVATQVALARRWRVV